MPPQTPQSGRLACLGERKTTAAHIFELLLPKLGRSNGQSRDVPGVTRNRSQETFKEESAGGRGASPPKFRMRPLLLKAQRGQEKRRKSRPGVWSTWSREDGNPLGWHQRPPASKAGDDGAGEQGRSLSAPRWLSSSTPAGSGREEGAGVPPGLAQRGDSRGQSGGKHPFPFASGTKRCFERLVKIILFFLAKKKGKRERERPSPSHPTSSRGRPGRCFSVCAESVWGCGAAALGRRPRS